MAKNPVHARMIIKIAALEASVRGQVDDPDRLIEILTPAAEEIESNARALIEDLGARLKQQREEYEAEINELRAELKLMAKLRDEADRDAAAISERPQDGPLANPHGYYVYYLWDRTNQLLYVGMSTNVLSRLGAHLSNRHRRHGIYRVTAVECPDEHAMRRTELRAIQQLNPRWNVMGIIDREDTA